MFIFEDFFRITVLDHTPRRDITASLDCWCNECDFFLMLMFTGVVGVVNEIICGKICIIFINYWSTLMIQYHYFMILEYLQQQ